MDEGRRAVLTVMVGLPATGKTTIARQVESEQGALRLTPDEWMVPLFNAPEADGKRDVLEGRFVWLAERALRAGVDVVLDFGVWSKNERMALRHLAADVGASYELRYVVAEHDEQVDRIARRQSISPHTSFEIGDDELRSFRALFEEPKSSELNSTEVDQPPMGFASWRAWMAERWPTSMD